MRKCSSSLVGFLTSLSEHPLHSGMCCALDVWDVWPMVAVLDDNDWIQNEAVAIPNDDFHWFVESSRDSTLDRDPRAGLAELSVTNSHWDGGWSTEGLFTYSCPGSFVTVDGNAQDEPDALWRWTFQGCDFVDLGAFYAPWATLHTIGVVASDDKHLLLDYSFTDSTVTDAVNIRPGDLFDASYFWSVAPKGTLHIERCRFERNGNFDENSAGQGGATLTTPPGGSLIPSYQFTSVEWVGNRVMSNNSDMDPYSQRFLSDILADRPVLGQPHMPPL